MTRSTSKVTFVVISDSHKIVANNKVDAVGIFDSFLIWATPATREFSVTVGFENLPVGTTELIIWKRVKGKARQVAQVVASSDSPQRLAISAQRLRLKISDLLDHEIGVGFRDAGARTIKWLPVAIKLQPWIELPTGDALKKLLSDPHAIRGLRAEVICDKCKPASKYIFEINADPAVKLDRGVKRFPESGRFTCPKCQTVHQLKDIEGQLRSHIGRYVPGGSK